jgi:hypothetical protein
MRYHQTRHNKGIYINCKNMLKYHKNQLPFARCFSNLQEDVPILCITIFSQNRVTQ